MSVDPDTAMFDDFDAPMLCKSTQRETLDAKGKWDGYLAEPKHDGTRCLAIRGAEGVELYTRTGHSYTDHVPHIVEALNAWMPRHSVIDGELAIIDSHITIGRKRVPVTNFNSTMRVMGSGAERGRELQETEFGLIDFIVYDMPRWDGHDLSGEYLADRRADLKANFPFGSPHLFLNPIFGDPSRFGELFDTLVDNGVEGIIIKNTSSLYVFDARPNATWYKVKAAVTIDMVVTGYTEGTGKYEGLIGAVEFGRWVGNGEGDDGGDTIHVSRCSGMTDALRRKISANRDAYLGRVIEVKSNELVGSKKYRTPRHPQFVAFRTDKLPEQCLGEELKQ